jgi:hypothetical protein
MPFISPDAVGDLAVLQAAGISARPPIFWGHPSEMISVRQFDVEKAMT